MGTTINIPSKMPESVSKGLLAARAYVREWHRKNGALERLGSVGYEAKKSGKRVGFDFVRAEDVDALAGDAFAAGGIAPIIASRWEPGADAPTLLRLVVTFYAADGECFTVNRDVPPASLSGLRNHTATETIALKYLWVRVLGIRLAERGEGGAGAAAADADEDTEPERERERARERPVDRRPLEPDSGNGDGAGAPEITRDGPTDSQVRDRARAIRDRLRLKMDEFGVDPGDRINIYREWLTEDGIERWGAGRPTAEDVAAVTSGASQWVRQHEALLAEQAAM